METNTTQGAAPPTQTAETSAVQTSPETLSAQPNPQTPATETNETANKLLAGKFKSVPDLEKSYQESQRELTKAKQELAALKKGANGAAQPAPEGDGTKTDATADEAQTAESVGTSLLDEYITNGGKLSPESKAKAAQSLGLPPTVVDQFEQFLAAQAQAGLTKIQEHFKDEGSFNVSELIDDMSKRLPQAKLDAIQTLIDQGEIEVLRPYVKEYVKTKLPPGQVGEIGGGGGGFKSAEERRRALMDPRWSDKAYREDFWRRNDASPEGIRMARQ